MHTNSFSKAILHAKKPQVLERSNKTRYRKVVVYLRQWFQEIHEHFFFCILATIRSSALSTNTIATNVTKPNLCMYTILTYMVKAAKATLLTSSLSNVRISFYTTKSQLGKKVDFFTIPSKGHHWDSGCYQHLFLCWFLFWNNKEKHC